MATYQDYKIQKIHLQDGTAAGQITCKYCRDFIIVPWAEIENNTYPLGFYCSCDAEEDAAHAYNVPLPYERDK